MINREIRFSEYEEIPQETFAIEIGPRVKKPYYKDQSQVSCKKIQGNNNQRVLDVEYV